LGGLTILSVSLVRIFPALPSCLVLVFEAIVEVSNYLVCRAWLCWGIGMAGGEFKALKVANCEGRYSVTSLLGVL
jgi:hypothetical protein